MSDDTGRRAVFIAAWRAHGNVRRAMRESGVGSPTTAYRWIRAWEARGAPDPEVFAAVPARIAPEIAEQVIALRQANPTWGKERIARRLAERHGQSVISATGVRSVLREAGLWAPPRVPDRAVGAAAIDTDWLVAELQRGIRLDLRNDPRGAVAVLGGEVWRFLYRREELVAALLREPEVGSWLLRSTLQLAHALIDTGSWASALWYLRLIDDWLRRDDAPLDPRLAAYQDAGDRWLAGDDDTWRTGEAPAGAARVSLRHDEIWLETQQYLGVVLRDAPGEVAIDALADARHALRGRTSRQYPQARRLHLQGVIAHDLAALELRGGYPVARVLADLDEAEALLAADGESALLATAAIARARALAASGAANDAIEAAIETGFERADANPVEIIRVKVTLDGVDVLANLREISWGERERLEAAARVLIDRGFAGQARKLLARPRLLELVADVEADLGRLLIDGGGS
jgi:transposase